MNSQNVNKRYVAFLRGINVGGHHKVPMADLVKEFEKLKFQNMETVLNSGNILFDAASGNLADVEITISAHIENIFGFPVPVIIRKSEAINSLWQRIPFKDIILTKDIRLYVSLLRNDTDAGLQLPWISDDKSFKIIEKNDKTILTVLNLAVSKSPKAMAILERKYGSDITTRNWNTIERIANKIRVT